MQQLLATCCKSYCKMLHSPRNSPAKGISMIKYVFTFMFILTTINYAQQPETISLIIDSDSTVNLPKLASLEIQTQQQLHQQHTNLIAYTSSPEYRQKVQQHKQHLEKLEKQKLYQQQVKEGHHKHEFGVSSEHLKNLYSMSYKQLEAWIIKSVNLTHGQAIAIWDGYCLKRCRGSKEKERIRNNINRIYQERDILKKALRQQQAEQKKHLQSVYRLELPAPESLSPESQDRWQQRTAALQKTINEQYKQESKSYHLDEQTAGYLLFVGLPTHEYEQCNGTTFQHHIHKELFKLAQTTAKLHSSIPYQSNMLQQAMLYNSTAISSNQHELFDLATHLTELNHGLLSTIQSISKEGNKLLAVAGKQCIESLQELPEQLANMTMDIAKLLYNMTQPHPHHDLTEEEIELFCQDQQLFHLQIDQRHQLTMQFLQTITDSAEQWLKQRSAQNKAEDIIKITTHAATTIVMPEIILQKLTLALSSMMSQLKRAQPFIASSKLLQEELALEIAGPEIEQLLYKKMNKELMHAMDWEIEECRNSAGQLIKIRGKKPTNNRIKDQALIKKATSMAQEHFIIPEQISKAVKEFATKHRYIQAEIDGILQTIEVDWEHILLPSIKKQTRYNPLTKQYELKTFEVNGWHHGLWQEFEKQGLIKIVNKIEKNECIYLDFDWYYNRTPDTKTLYPDSWSYEKILESIQEALSTSKPNFTHDNPLKLSLLGKTQNNIEIIIHLQKQSKHNPWKIHTAFINKKYILKANK